MNSLLHKYILYSISQLINGLLFSSMYEAIYMFLPVKWQLFIELVAVLCISNGLLE